MARLIPILDDAGNYADTIDLESARCVWESLEYDGGLPVDVALWRLPGGLWLYTDTSYQCWTPLTTGRLTTREQAIDDLLKLHVVPPDELLRDAEPATDKLLRDAEPATDAPAGDAAAVEPAPSGKATVGVQDKRLWTVQAAEQVVRNYLKTHPYATAKAIEAETGIPDSTVCKTGGWINRPFKRRKGKRSGQTKRGAVSLTDKVMAIAEKVAGPDVDIEGLIRRCEAEPELRQTLEDAYEASMANETQQKQGRRPIA